MSDEKKDPGTEQEKPKPRRVYKKRSSGHTTAQKQETSRAAKPASKTSAAKGSPAKGKADLSDESIDLLVNLKNEFSKTRGSLAKEKVDGLKKNIDQFFKKHKISEFGKSGDNYDPKIHYALLFMKEEGVEEKKVLEVKSRGIKAGKTLIRKSKVIVSK